MQNFDFEYFDDLTNNDGYKGYTFNGSGFEGSRDRENEVNYIIEKFNPKKVIEIGCAKGYLIYLLQQKGIEVLGYEVSDYAISKSIFRELNLTEKITKYDLSKCEFIENADLLICQGVLQYISEDLIDTVLRFLSNKADYFDFGNICYRSQVVALNPDKYRKITKDIDWWREKVSCHFEEIIKHKNLPSWYWKRKS